MPLKAHLYTLNIGWNKCAPGHSWRFPTYLGSFDVCCTPSPTPSVHALAKALVQSPTQRMWTVTWSSSGDYGKIQRIIRYWLWTDVSKIALLIINKIYIHVLNIKQLTLSDCFMPFMTSHSLFEWRKLKYSGQKGLSAYVRQCQQTSVSLTAERWAKH